MFSPRFRLDFAIEEQWHIEYPLFRIAHFCANEKEFFLILRTS